MALRAVHEVLERNQLYAVNVEAPGTKPSVVVAAQINTNVSGMSDAELDRLERLLTELKAVTPPDVIEGQKA